MKAITTLVLIVCGIFWIGGSDASARAPLSEEEEEVISKRVTLILDRYQTTDIRWDSEDYAFILRLRGYAQDPRIQDQLIRLTAVREVLPHTTERFYPSDLAPASQVLRGLGMGVAPKIEAAINNPETDAWMRLVLKDILRFLPGGNLPNSDDWFNFMGPKPDRLYPRKPRSEESMAAARRVLAALSDDELRKVIVTPFDDRRWDTESIVVQTFERQNLGLIALCFEDRDLAVEAVRSFDRLPLSNFRDHVLLVVLRAGSAVWPEHPHDTSEAYGVADPDVIAALRKSCRTGLRRYLSESVVGQYPLLEREKRFQIAALFEREIKSENSL